MTSKLTTVLIAFGFTFSLTTLQTNAQSQFLPTGDSILKMTGEEIRMYYVNKVKSIPRDTSQHKANKSAEKNNQPTEEYKLLNKKAPSFIGISTEGEKFDLKETKGKVVFLNFMSIYCPPCLFEISTLIKTYDQLKTDTNVVFATLAFEDADIFNRINTQTDTTRKVRIMSRYFDSQKIVFPILVKSEKIANKYKVSGRPSYVIIDKNGIIKHMKEGFNPFNTPEQNSKDILDKINSLLN